MNNENFLSPQDDRQNQLIDALLKENAYLKGIISTYLLPGIDENKPELKLLQLLVEKNGTQSSAANTTEGKSGSLNALADIAKGNRSFLNSFVHSGEGNSSFPNALPDSTKGNSGIKNAFAEKTEGNEKEILARLAAGIRPLMLYSTYTSRLNTAKILLQLYRNPATPLAELRSISGLSPDGMAKRIMAMKKAGLIVRYSAPMRYVLTEKAKALLVKPKATDYDV